MKNSFTFVLLSISIILIGLFTSAVIPDTKGPHGGELKSAGDYMIELDRTETTIEAYLFDSLGQAMGNRKISCEVILFYFDCTEYTVRMSPNGKEGFIGFVPDSFFSSCDVTFSYGDKQVTASFENPVMIVGVNRFIRLHRLEI